MKSSRAQVWLENLDDWRWPGTGGAAAVEVLPPPWVPTLPPRLERTATASDDGAVADDSWQRQRISLRLGTGALLSALLAVCCVLAIGGPLRLERLAGLRAADHASVAAAATDAPGQATLPPVTLRRLYKDSAGSAIDTASFSSVALHGSGSFITYLPAGFASSTKRYPVLYLLHGNDQLATAFLQIGLQRELDRLIARHVIPPLIAVMIQGGRGGNNWRMYHGRDYETYVVETQELVDRTLPTVADRGARAIAGDSMGGYGAMNVTLSNPERFGTVESWLGFFNGLEPKLVADRPVLAGMGLHAFVYGGASDVIADPSENGPFAAQLRAAGAEAHSAVYPGGHSLETIEAHLASMLTFAGRALSKGIAPAPGQPAANAPA